VWQHVTLLALGLFFLWKGSDVAVTSATKLADKYGISQTLVGLTILSVGTSLPEIFTNIYSGIQVAKGVDASGVAVGTIIGSEVGQITLVLGVTGLVGSMRCDAETLRRDGSMMLIAVAAMFLCCLDGHVSQVEGALLCATYIGYLLFLAHTTSVVKTIADSAQADAQPQIRTGVEIIRVVGGLAVLLIGTKLGVDNAVAIAPELGISQSMVGIFIIGVGTSLPELSIAVAGVRNKAAAVSLGALIGSNITDPLLSLGAGASIAGFDADKSLLRFDIPFWLLATLIALMLLRRGGGIGKGQRIEGALLISLFALFTVLKLSFDW